MNKHKHCQNCEDCEYEEEEYPPEGTASSHSNDSDQVPGFYYPTAIRFTANGVETQWQPWWVDRPGRRENGPPRRRLGF